MTDTKLTAEQAVEEIRKRINTENYTVFYHDVMRILSRVQQGEVPADLEQRAREAHAQLNDLMMHFAERERLWPPVAAKTADVHAAIDTLAQAARAGGGHAQNCQCHAEPERDPDSIAVCDWLDDVDTHPHPYRDPRCAARDGEPRHGSCDSVNPSPDGPNESVLAQEHAGSPSSGSPLSPSAMTVVVRWTMSATASPPSNLPSRRRERTFRLRWILTP